MREMDCRFKDIYEVLFSKYVQISFWIAYKCLFLYIMNIILEIYSQTC